VTFQIDEDEIEPLVYGAGRGDTFDTCGDIDNGFEKLINWSDVGHGSHTITIFVDGQKFGESSFEVATLGLGNYPLGLRGRYSLENFPTDDKTTHVKWSEIDQNFIIYNVSDVLSSTDVSGYWDVTYTRTYTCVGKFGRDDIPADKFLDSVYLQQENQRVDFYSVINGINGEVREFQYTGMLINNKLEIPQPNEADITFWDYSVIFTADDEGEYHGISTTKETGSECIFSIVGSWLRK